MFSHEFFCEKSFPRSHYPGFYRHLTCTQINWQDTRCYNKPDFPVEEYYFFVKDFDNIHIVTKLQINNDF